jgi:excisionase family DNA binding protein
VARHTPITKPRCGPVKRIAAEYGFAYTSVRDLIHRGEIPVIRMGRAQYIEYSDMDRWVATRKEIA